MNLTNKKMIGVATILVALVGVALGFQNCGQQNRFASTGSGSDNPVVQGADGDPAVTAVSGDAVISNDSPIVEIKGNCSQTGGEIVVTGDVVSSETCTCGTQDPTVTNDDNPTTNGSFEVCAVVPNFGLQNFTITQTNGDGETSVVTIPIRTTFPIIVNISLEITNIVLVGDTGADITISCVAGSTISADAYGANMLSTPTITCSTNNTAVLNIRKLIKKGTGDRIVTINMTYAGKTTTVKEDVDNKVTAHVCSIDQGLPNVDICVNSAGTISGTCKAGPPVKIYVNDVLQQTVSCLAGKFTANDVLLTKNADNKISISQKTPFESTAQACKDSVVVDNIADVNNAN